MKPILVAYISILNDGGEGISLRCKRRFRGLDGTYSDTIASIAVRQKNTTMFSIL